MQAESAAQLRSLLEETVESNSNSGILNNPIGTAESVAQTIKHNVPMPEDAADILKTVGKLKALSPLYTYAVYHPLRFLFQYLILPLPSLLLFLVLAILQVLAYVVRTLFYPFYVAFYFITAPARIALGFLQALMPVWIFLGSAILIGCCVGALAGLLMGDTTKYAIEKTLDVAVWPLRVVGLVEPSKFQTKEKNKFGANGGATIERIPEKKRRSAEKGKSRAAGSSRVKREEEEETTTDDERKSPSFTERKSSRWTGQRATNGRRSMDTSSSSEEEDNTTDSSKGGSWRRGRSPDSRNHNVKSGWRKRNVQDVLQ
ncbi:hypothetical protein JCM5350_005087 [Sporobolomyces pararoseus]